MTVVMNFGRYFICFKKWQLRGLIGLSIFPAVFLGHKGSEIGAGSILWYERPGAVHAGKDY
jgi:hypothetical protein